MQLPLNKNYSQFSLAIVLILVMGIASIFLPQLLTLGNMMQVARQAAVLGIIAIGVTFVVIAGRLDLSVGSMLSLCSVVLVTFHESIGPVPAMGAALAIGVLCGCINGFLVAYLGLNSLIATLGMLSLLQGLALIYTSGANALISSPSTAWFSVFGRGFFFGIPVPIVIMAVLAILMGFVLTSTSFGRRVVAVGGNQVATRYSAIDTKKTIFFAYVISGLMTGFGAIVLSSRVMAARLDSGAGYELLVLSGIILGGTSLLGGSGGIGRTVFGIIVLGFIQNILLLMGLPYITQWVVTWVVIILAVGIDVISKRGSVLA